MWVFLHVHVRMSVCAGKMSLKVRLTHPSACVAAGSETRSGPCLSKHASRHIQHRSSGQETADRGEETRINR